MSRSCMSTVSVISRVRLAGSISSSSSAVASALFCSVHGGVGVAEQALRRAGGGAPHGDAQAGGGEHLPLSEYEGRFERFGEPAGQVPGLVEAVDLFAHDEELVTAEARHG